jgi:hypothetical protein
MRRNGEFLVNVHGQFLSFAKGGTLDKTPTYLAIGDGAAHAEISKSGFGLVVMDISRNFACCDRGFSGQCSPRIH